jgi:hypothetical protein
MKMEEMHSFKTSVNIYHSTGRHNTGHQNIQDILLWNLKVRYHINKSPSQYEQYSLTSCTSLFLHAYIPRKHVQAEIRPSCTSYRSQRAALLERLPQTKQRLSK